MHHILGPCKSKFSSSVQPACPSHDLVGPPPAGSSLLEAVPKGASWVFPAKQKRRQGSKRDWLEIEVTCLQHLTTKNGKHWENVSSYLLRFAQWVSPCFTIRSDRTPCAWLSALVAPGDDELPMGSPCKTPGGDDAGCLPK